MLSACEREAVLLLAQRLIPVVASYYPASSYSVSARMEFAPETLAEWTSRIWMTGGTKKEVYDFVMDDSDTMDAMRAALA